MTHPRTPTSGRARRAATLTLLLFGWPLVLGARGCGGDDEPGGGEAGTQGGTAGSDAGDGGGGGDDGCLYDGVRYDVGDGFPSEDGCNTCSCMAEGVSCTLRACAGSGGEAGGGEAGSGEAGGGEAGSGEAGGGGSGGGDGACGGLLGLACDDGEFCNYAPDAQCGAADGTGTCLAIPEACDLQYEPVCGCDGNTYGNDCEAAANQVSIVSTGECDGGGGGSGETCGGIASLECASEDEFCNYEESAGGQGCDGSISDAGGVCQTRPSACTREYAPVCGCDRRTYGTACTAHSEGASVLHEGECTEIDCEAIGGHAVDGIGPPAVCPTGETDFGPIRYSNGMIAFEGTICCVP